MTFTAIVGTAMEAPLQCSERLGWNKGGGLVLLRFVRP